MGNGAFGGRIPEGDLHDALAGGYATAGTDDGHDAKPADASWALGHPEKVVETRTSPRSSGAAAS